MPKLKRKRQKKAFEVGQYFVLRYPGHLYAGHTYRLVYIVAAYQSFRDQKGKKVNRPIQRYKYVQVDFNCDLVQSMTGQAYDAIYCDHTESTLKNHIHMGRWSVLEKAELDLTFVVKYGGPNSIVRIALEQEEKKRLKEVHRAQEAFREVQETRKKFEEHFERS